MPLYILLCVSYTRHNEFTSAKRSQDTSNLTEESSLREMVTSDLCHGIEITSLSV